AGSLQAMGYNTAGSGGSRRTGTRGSDKLALDREAVEEVYYTTKAELMDIGSPDPVAPGTPAAPHAPGQPRPNQYSAIKQRAPDLPKFDGNYLNWQSFIDRFNAAIHRDGRFSGAQKLEYLIDCMVGEAKNHIKDTAIT